MPRSTPPQPAVVHAPETDHEPEAMVGPTPETVVGHEPEATVGHDAEVMVDHDAETMVGAILRASRVLMGVSARSLATVDDSLTLPQFRMLVVLEVRGALSLSRLAGHLGVNPSTAMRMIGRLVTAGMVARQSNPRDRRETVLTLTDTGHRVVADALAGRRAEISRIVAAMPVEHRSSLVAALRAFARAAGEPCGPGAEPEHPGW